MGSHEGVGQPWAQEWLEGRNQKSVLEIPELREKVARALTRMEAGQRSEYLMIAATQEDKSIKGRG